MDAGNPLPSLYSLSDWKRRRRNSQYENLDRFIPNRAAMDFGFAHFMLMGGKVENDTPYKRLLAETLNMNRTRILAFGNKPAPGNKDTLSPPKFTSSKHLRRVSQSCERTLDAPEIVDDYYLNLLDWSASNIIAIGLGYSVYLWDANSGATSELLSTDDERGLVTSLKWAPDGRRLAVGFTNSEVQLWDSSSNRLMRTLREVHRSRVGSLDWNHDILTTGSRDGLIVNNDLRIRSHDVQTYRGHSEEVCALKWSKSGQQLASGGSDNLLYIWDFPSNQRLHRFSDHTSAVKALSWCPFQSSLLASGGIEDHCIKFWKCSTGARLNSVDTGSQVSCLLWNSHERELLSSHGFDKNELLLWKYPSMIKLAELQGHTSRILYMTRSPDGYTVASAAADETMRFWNVFGSPQLAKIVDKTKAEPFAAFPRIR